MGDGVCVRLMEGVGVLVSGGEGVLEGVGEGSGQATVLPGGPKTSVLEPQPMLFMSGPGLHLPVPVSLLPHQ